MYVLTIDDDSYGYPKKKTCFHFVRKNILSFNLSKKNILVFRLKKKKDGLTKNNPAPPPPPQEIKWSVPYLQIKSILDSLPPIKSCTQYRKQILFSQKYAFWGKIHFSGILKFLQICWPDRFGVIDVLEAVDMD